MTWISAAEASALLKVRMETVIKRIRKGIYNGHQSSEHPFNCEGKPNWLVLVESLPSTSQKEFYRNKNKTNSFSLNLLKARSILGNVYLEKAIALTEILKQTAELKTNGSKTQAMKSLAKANGISLSTLYRIVGSEESKQAGPLFKDPSIEMVRIPKTMCQKSIDIAVSMDLKDFTQIDIFQELRKTEYKCDNCEFKTGTHHPCSKPVKNQIYLPNNPKTLSRLLSKISPQLGFLYKNGKIEFISKYGIFALRSKTMCFGELWEADHKVLSIRVAVTITTEKNGKHYSRILCVHPVVTAFIDTATKLYTGLTLSIIPNSDTIADAFIEAVRKYAPPSNIRTDCGKDYQSIMLQALPEELQNSFLEEDSFLNRHFSGCGVLTLFNTEVNSASPYHPQAKPCIERSFRILDELTVKAIGDNRIFSYEQFADIFFKEIVPSYQNTPWKYTDDNPPENWETSYSDKSPMERYYSIPAVRTSIPKDEDLSLLRFHRKDGCKVRSNGIRFSNCWYYATELEKFTGPDSPTVSIQFNRVSNPLAPKSVSVIYNNSFVCEAFAMETLLQHHENAAEYLYFLDCRNHRISELNSSIKRINRSAEALLPDKYTNKKIPDEKDQLRNMELMQTEMRTQLQSEQKSETNTKRIQQVKAERLTATAILNDLSTIGDTQ